MVLVTELPNAFWGVTVNEGKRYTQKSTGAIHVSMAALEPGSNKGDDGPVSVMIQHDKANFMLCSLSSGQTFQQALDLNFNEGEEVTFYLKGKGVVHLTGYVLTGDQFDSDSDDEDFTPGNLFVNSDEDSSSSEDGGGDTLSGSKKRKKQIMDKKSKKPRVEIVGDDEDDEDDDDEENGHISDDDDDDSSDDDESEGRYELIDDEAEEESDMDDDDDDDDEEETPKKKSDKKKPEQVKKQQPTPSGQSKKDKKDKHSQKAAESAAASKEGLTTSTETGEKKKRKRKKNKNKNKESENSTQASAESTGPSKPSSKVVEGVTVEDLKVGHGPEAKSGSTVHVYYTGRLVNGKLFDMKNTGKPAKFRLGKKEIIKGWDVGIQDIEDKFLLRVTVGMKVGGRRKLVIPPNMGYGSQSAGTIPPNSTLQFEVELKAVN